MENEILNYKPVRLAYIGDAVYEVYIRQMILKKYDYPMDKISKLVIRYVNATSQSKIILQIFDLLSEKEKLMVKKGRNLKTKSSAKNASIREYRYATGFECLIGYLYILEDFKRIEKIIKMGVNVLDEKVE